MNWLSLLIPMACLGGDGRWRVPSADELLRAAGVERSAPGEANRERLVAPGFLDLEWRDPDGALRFQVLPGAEGLLFSSSERPRTSVPWSAEVAPAVFAGPRPTLVLRADPSGVKARGRLALTPSAQPASARGPIRLTGVTSGCSMTVTTPFPVALDADEISLDFEWDLHSPVALNGRHVRLDGDFAHAPTFCVQLEDSDPLLVAEPRTLALASDDASDAVVVVRTRPGLQLEPCDVEHSPCVALVAATRGADAFELKFRATALARAYHVCSGVTVRAWLGADPEPYVRMVSLSHQAQICDGAGVPIHFGVFSPGEIVELWARGQEQRLAFVDRLTFVRGVLAQGGFQQRASATIPERVGPVDLVLGDAGATVRLQGIATDDAASFMERWVALSRD